MERRKGEPGALALPCFHQAPRPDRGRRKVTVVTPHIELRFSGSLPIRGADRNAFGLPEQANIVRCGFDFQTMAKPDRLRNHGSILLLT